MVQLKNLDWWSAAWAVDNSPSATAIFAEGIFEGCGHSWAGLNVVYTYKGQTYTKMIRQQLDIDFKSLCDQLGAHSRKPMSFINDLYVIH